MLAVFNKSVAKSPEGLQSPQSNSVSSLKDDFLSLHFASLHPSSVNLNLASSAFLAYSLHKNNPLLQEMSNINIEILIDFPLRLFAVVDDIFCLFQGHVDNVANLKQQYGLNKSANEVTIVIEAYRTLRDRRSSQTVFVASDADGSVPFFWGIDADENLVLSDEIDIVRKSCGKSYAPFPKGCFFTTSAIGMPRVGSAANWSSNY
ncbi:unnamed protein product [Vicia faba]|uniref:DUF3700 domain-containing protein n=1 Tax=Vicia faba TaxID=3906 RepID=A0AAV0ZTJ1_VICFA|nr:unnamed protein product [Vicia faba]